MVQEIVDKAERLCKNLECDGTARVLTYLLTEAKIGHSVKCGSVTDKIQTVTPHFWIELKNGEVIDLKARMWLGDDAPHGIFKKKKAGVVYEGETIDMKVSKQIYEILIRI